MCITQDYNNSDSILNITGTMCDTSVWEPISIVEYSPVGVAWTNFTIKECSVEEDQKERSKPMISRKTFNEALAEIGVSKKDRRRVEKLTEQDFEYLLASLLAQVFEPEDLDIFEPEVQKVKVVED